MKDTFVIIDGNNLMFRAFYALPQLANFDGEISIIIVDKKYLM